MPGISVIVPLYQAERFVEQCVESVRQQTFTDWELLLIDDGSTDATPVLCDRLAEDPRIRVFHKPNGGVSSARNLGLQEAAGKYIAFLDADDRFAPEALATMWQLLDSTGADTAGCAHWNLTPAGERTPELLLQEGVYDRQGIREGIVYPLLGDRLTQPVFNGYIWRYLFSAQIIRGAKITFEGAYLEDELFLMEYFCNAEKLAVTEQPLYEYLLNPNSATHKYMRDLMQVFGRFMERKEALAARYGLDEARPRWREMSNWAGLLIAVGNEFAAGNPRSVRERRTAVEALCARPEMARAIETVKPAGLGRNKQMVADLIRGRHFFLLTLLYRIKNRL